MFKGMGVLKWEHNIFFSFLAFIFYHSYSSFFLSCLYPLSSFSSPFLLFFFPSFFPYCVIFLLFSKNSSNNNKEYLFINFCNRTLVYHRMFQLRKESTYISGCTDAVGSSLIIWSTNIIFNYFKVLYLKLYIHAFFSPSRQGK